MFFFWLIKLWCFKPFPTSGGIMVPQGADIVALPPWSQELVTA